MKQKGIFRLLAIGLSLALLCGIMMSSALAVETDFTATDADAAIFEESAEQEGLAKAAAAASKAGIVSIRAYPFVICEETGEVFLDPQLYAYKTWSIPYPSSSLILSPAQFNSLNGRLIAQFEDINDGLTYTLKGWRVIANVEFSAYGQLRYTPDSNFHGTPTEFAKTFYPNQTHTVDLHFVVSPALTTYKLVKCQGGFYPTSGSSEMFVVGLGVNSTSSSVNASIT